jgi:sugar phosphate isomerase/epimerase
MAQEKLAAQLYTVREFTQNAKDLAETLKKIQAIGYPAVQISAIGSDIPDAEVKTIADDAGLVICNTHVRPADALWSDIDAVIKQHRTWNCKHVATGMMPKAFREEGESGFKRFAEEASQIGGQLAEAGMTFSYHNHSFELVRYGTRTGLDIIYDESDPRYLQAEIDTYWIQHGGADPVAWIAKMENRMPAVHLKDMTVIPGEGALGQQIMAEVGEGNLNWPAILQACCDIGVEWYVVEQDTCQRDPFESLKISYENLQTLLND